MTSVFYHEDKAEFSEFLKVAGYKNNGTDNTIDDEKKRFFILCFTKNYKEPKFWSKYAQDDTGVCFSLRLKHKMDNENRYQCQFRDVFYDNGSEFNFVKDLRSECHKFFNKELFIDGVTKFAQFYKRSCYSWEDEARISINIDPKNNALVLNQKLAIEKEINNKGELTREYITINFDNDFFKLEIDEIICGKRVTKGQIAEIKKAINNSSVKVARRIVSIREWWENLKKKF